MSDDHTSQAISAYGGILDEVCPTTQIDRLANEGMLFTNCFVTNSICTPSRAAIWTGKYAHKNGVYKFTALDQRQTILPKLMQKAGYQTAFIGKYHLHSNPVGLDYFSILPGQGRYHDPQFIKKGDEHPSGWVQQGKRTVIEGHSSDAIADQALDYLKNKRSKDKPFILFCHFKAPHDIWKYAERYENFLQDVEIPEPDNLFDDYEGRSDALKNTLQYIGSEWGNHTNFEEETNHLKGKARKKMQYQLYMKKYLRCVKGVDDNVGRILDFLDNSGLANNTIVMYTGDQGFFLGEHGLYDKRFMYEEALRMPFLVRWPGHIKNASKSDDMILNIDFAPTILEAAGEKVPQEMQGKSFLPITKGKKVENWRKSMYYRYYYSHFETEPHYGVRTHKHKLIHFDRINQWELYNLEDDPYEMDNLYDKPEYQDVVGQLKKELTSLQTELGDDPADRGNNPIIGTLTPAPMHVERNVQFYSNEISILIRFRTNAGGTLFSICNLDKNSYRDAYSSGENKTLFINNSGLVLQDGEDEFEIDANLLDNQWHTIALLVKDMKPQVYIDGSMAWNGKKNVSTYVEGKDFNIGAGIDDGGYTGYNFIGTISHILVFEEQLNIDQIQAFAKGREVNNIPILSWIK
jgi:arylsulfatase A-like enzyme